MIHFTTTGFTTHIKSPAILHINPPSSIMVNNQIGYQV